MEENKVAQKLKNVIWDEITGGQRSGCEGTADCVTRAILQSPDLRVTLVEPRYHWIGKCVYRVEELRKFLGDALILIDVTAKVGRGVPSLTSMPPYNEWKESAEKVLAGAHAEEKE